MINIIMIKSFHLKNKAIYYLKGEQINMQKFKLQCKKHDKMKR